MRDDGTTTWGELRRLSDGELRAATLMEPRDDEFVTVGDIHAELERREREEIIRQIRFLLVIAALSLMVIAVMFVFVALLAFGVLHPIDQFRGF
jgi:hypothetical protein